ncbi:unnamed protein product, partial [Cyprideis torosa]
MAVGHAARSFAFCCRNKALILLLGNMYRYYSQFQPAVEARIRSQRDPIDKEIKDFVRISRAQVHCEEANEEEADESEVAELFPSFDEDFGPPSTPRTSEKPKVVLQDEDLAWVLECHRRTLELEPSPGDGWRQALLKRIDSVFKVLREVIAVVLGLPVSSPLVRFTNGLERILEKAHAWSEVAHRGIKMEDETRAVAEVVLRWRKMELLGWEELLGDVDRRFHLSATKWWAHIFQLLVASGKTPTTNEIYPLLVTLIEESTLGEFSTRLSFLKLFQTHLECRLPREKALVLLLGNMYRYYSQFQPAVEARIRSQRDPIDKEIKDFVRISRWNDSNFWQLKESVSKSHRTLHKKMKLWKNILRESVNSHLTIATSKKDSNEIPVELDEPAGSSLTKDESLSEPSRSPLEMSLERSELGARLPRARKLVEDLLKSFNGYYHQPLDEFVALVPNIVSTCNELAALKVTSSEQEERKKEIHHLSIRKRRALADLFTLMNKCGISYRKGLNILNKAAEKNEAIPEWVSCALLRTTDSKDRFYAAAWALSKFQSVVSNPQSKDLGPADLQRCKGILSHLMRLSLAQRKLVTDSEERVDRLKKFRRILREIATTGTRRNPVRAKERTDNIRRLVARDNSSRLVEESTDPRLALLLDSIPTADEEGEDSEFFFFFKTSSGHTNELPLDGKNSVKWQEAQSAVSSCEGRCRSLIGSLTSHLKQE